MSTVYTIYIVNIQKVHLTNYLTVLISTEKQGEIVRKVKHKQMMLA